MKRRQWFIRGLVGVLVTLGATNGSGADLTLSVSPADGTTMLVKQFTVSAGTTILGLEFRNNDPRTTFPEVILARDVGASMSEGTVVARAANVSETVLGAVRVFWSQPVLVVDQAVYYAAIRMPAGERKEGLGRGPGIGASEVPTTSGSFIAGGFDGELNAIRADLSLALVTGGVGKPTPEQAEIPRTFLSGTSPMQTVATIRFGVERRTHVVLDVYNVAGQRVRRLYTGPVEAGVYTREWDGRDDRGHDVAAGIYIANLQAGERIITQKLVLAK